MSQDPTEFHFDCTVPTRMDTTADVFLATSSAGTTNNWSAAAGLQVPVVAEEDVVMDVGNDISNHASERSLLTEVNFDIQSHVMSLLPASDLSALMQTCQYFSDIALPPLCEQSGKPLKSPSQILSFLQFLRLDRPNTSRASYIKEITFSLEEYRAPLTKAGYLHTEEEKNGSSSHFALPEVHPMLEEHLLRTTRNSALQAFLQILARCCNIRRLRVDRWFDDVPIALLLNAVTALSELEDLQMPMFPRSQWGTNMQLVCLPLRKLVLRPGRWFEIAECLSALLPLSATLVELDLPVCQWSVPGMSFPNVQKLGIEFPASEDVVSDLIRTFPNLSHLFLRGTRNSHFCHMPSSRQTEDRLREGAQYQWHALAGSRSTTGLSCWPTLLTVGAENPCTLYTLAIPFHVPRISVGYSTGEPAEDMLPVILKDTHPTCLEMTIKQVHYKYTPLPSRFGQLQPSEGTTALRRFILTLEGDGIPDYIHVSTLLLWELQRVLAKLPVDHILLNHSIDHFRASRSYTPKIVRTICVRALRRAKEFAHAVPSLRWIGIRVHVQGGPTWLYSWQVDRVSQRRQDLACVQVPPPPSFTLMEMSEDAGWEVLRREGMYEVAATVGRC